MVILSKKYMLIAFIATSSLTVFSQNKLLDIANKQYELFEYMNAQKAYLELVESGYESSDLYGNLGNTYYFNSQFEEALKWYKKLIMSYGGSIDSEYYYRYAQTLKSVNNYKEADLYMQAFAKLNPEDTRVKIFLNNRMELEKSEDLRKQYNIKNLSMNSDLRDFGASYFEKSIIFSSSRNNSNEKDKDMHIHEWNNEPYLDMYIATRDSLSGELYEINKWNSTLNTELHESTPIYTKDYKTIYYTGNTIEKRKVKKIKKGKIETNMLKIFYATLNEDGRWTKARELPFCSDEYSTAHPALSADGTKMYFSSDMPGGKGESDLYEVEIKSDGTFGDPRNLGDIINTEGKETFPFIAANDELYFASDGHLGYGGLDVFKIAIKDIEAGKNTVLNLGEPINSKDDDFCFAIQDDLKRGYFSSNRLGNKGKDDIYSFEEMEFKEGDDLALKLQLSPIYFDLDKSFIRPDASVILDQVVDVMNKYPSMKIYIRSHTDSRASKLYNEGLSERRAFSTRMYLIKKGIRDSRLTSKGFGEYELLNKCSDGVKCNEEEHQLNRRSEFIITEL
jgi:outer membrane protein OmpA-like peptidoglycan-associated protein/tetratricopeptide (TPR) repeat protein